MGKNKVDYTSMDVEELEARLRSLDEDKQEIRREMLAVHAELDRKNQDAEAAALVERMSDSQREALARAIPVQGIDASAQVGTPGS